MGSNMNVNQLDVNSIVGMKEPQSQQSRLKQWTTMDGLSPATPPPDHNPLKNGNYADITWGSGCIGHIPSCTFVFIQRCLQLLQLGTY